MLFDRPSAKRFEEIKVDGFDDPVSDAAEIGKTVFQRIEGTETVRVVKHFGTKPSVTIPEAVTVSKVPYSVTEIGENAFAGLSEMTSITLPDSIESIGESAFSGCVGLTEIYVPRGIKNIRGRAFAGCKGITRIVMKDSPETIGKSSFEGCSSLRTFVIEKGKGNFTSDTYGSMYDGEMKTLIRVPYGIEGTADIPPGVEEISDGAFSGCTDLTSVRIPASVRMIGDKVFSGCRKLALLYVDPRNKRYRSDLQGILYDSKVTEVIRAPNSIAGVLDVPNTVRTIRSNAFEGCSGLVSISIPVSTNVIGDSAFEGCSKVRSINFSGGVTRIGNCAFMNCSGIISVTIPDSVETIGDKAFYGCSRLNSVSLPISARIGEQAFPVNSDIVME